ncbi:hypothetical protein THAOC_04150, partial [Thalassiosira oceanica]
SCLRRGPVHDHRYLQLLPQHAHEAFRVCQTRAQRHSRGGYQRIPPSREGPMDGHVYVKVRKGMYSLPQAGILAQELLLSKPSGPCLWLHKWRPIQFSLVANDFGVKYVGEEHARHLVDIPKADYKITEDWEGGKHIGIDLEWDYTTNGTTQNNNLTARGLRQDSPRPHIPPKYGAKQQFAAVPDSSPALDKAGLKFIQQVVGKFLYLARDVNCTILPALSSLSSQQAEPTKTTLQRTHQLLHYLASQEEAVLTYSASNGTRRPQRCRLPQRAQHTEPRRRQLLPVQGRPAST